MTRNSTAYRSGKRSDAARQETIRRRYVRSVKRGAAGLVLAGVTVAGVTGPADASVPRVDRHTVTGQLLPEWVVTPCHEEDDVDCTWDAGTTGNGTGHSFIVREVPGRARLVCVFYVQTRYAARHDYCTVTR